MRLDAEFSEADLLYITSSLAGRLKPVALGRLKVGRLGNFLALVINHEFSSAAINDVAELSGLCVSEVDFLRAPLSFEERKRRTGLSPREGELFEQWGYPYVFDCFHFHMTLTAALKGEELEIALREINHCVSEAVEEVQFIDSICVFGEPSTNNQEKLPFELIARYDLGG